ncbi:amidohydrolase family protein [soil metagenome]
MTTYTARWIFPVSQPPLERGTVTVDGERIVAVEPHGSRTPDVDLGNIAIIPGLVNAHTHLDLSGARGLIPPTDPEHFTDWLIGVIAYRKTRTPEQVQADIREGLAECLKFGTTLLSDIAAGGESWKILSDSQLRARIDLEVICLAQERINDVAMRAIEWLKDHVETEHCTSGLSLHSPYSIHRDAFRHLAERINISIHLAESPSEVELVHRHTGRHLEFLNALQVWEPDSLVESFEFVYTRLRVARTSLFIHGNYLSGDEKIWPRQTIVFCPRTHAAFKHPRHPVLKFLNRGVRVALGTDSLASNPDLDLLAEARFTFQHYPEVAGELIMEMATINGAEAVDCADTCGSLVPGKSADFVTVPLPDDESDPYELLLGTTAIDGPRRTLFRGEWRS